MERARGLTESALRHHLDSPMAFAWIAMVACMSWTLGIIVFVPSPLLQVYLPSLEVDLRHGQMGREQLQVFINRWVALWTK